MRAEKVVASLLGSSSAVAAIVGEKITAVLGLQSDQAPFVVYWKDQATRTPVISGNGSATVVATMSVQFIALDYETLKDLAEAGRLALVHQYGTIAGVEVNDIQVAAEGSDFYEPDLGIYGQLWQFNVTHQE